MVVWAKRMVVWGALSSLLACGSGRPVAQDQTTVDPRADVAKQDGPQVMIDGSSLVLIEDAASTPLVIYFDVDSAVIEPELRSTLDALALFLREHNRLRVDVEGHADERGPDVYNEGLSLRRAEAVKQYLVEHGVDSDKLVARGFGEQRPLTTADDASHRRNRRVEFVTGADPQLSAATTAAR